MTQLICFSTYPACPPLPFNRGEATPERVNMYLAESQPSAIPTTTQSTQPSTPIIPPQTSTIRTGGAGSLIFPVLFFLISFFAIFISLTKYERK